mmetsp:Transcript_2966/g.6262  ORF Transcript_2966/g.6262 Transcript_2966/m.6262 type:complete len:340 (-) Transcript_2966:533-1552(-)
MRLNASKRAKKSVARSVLRGVRTLSNSYNYQAFKQQIRREYGSGRSIVVGADAQPLDGLAARVGAALGVCGPLVLDVGRGRADERAVLGAGGGVLEGALRHGGHARRHVGRAGLEEAGALGRAEVAGDALDGDLRLVRKAAARRVGVVRRRGGRRRRRRGAGRWRGSDRLRAGGVRRLLREAAHVLVAHHADVPLLAPRRAPRVLHLPVVLPTRAVCAVPDDQHAVVEAGAARRRVEHARLVQLEGRLVRLDRDGDGLRRDGREKRLLVALGHVLVAGDGDDRRARLGARAGGAAARGVRVRLLRADAPVLLDPLERIVHQPTRAALVAVVVALHEVLL